MPVKLNSKLYYPLARGLKEGQLHAKEAAPLVKAKLLTVGGALPGDRVRVELTPLGRERLTATEAAWEAAWERRVSKVKPKRLTATERALVGEALSSLLGQGQAPRAVVDRLVKRNLARPVGRAQRAKDLQAWRVTDVAREVYARTEAEEQAKREREAARLTGAQAKVLQALKEAGGEAVLPQKPSKALGKKGLLTVLGVTRYPVVALPGAKVGDKARRGAHVKLV